MSGCFPGSGFNLDDDLAACVTSMGWSDEEIDSNGDGDLDGVELMVLINRCELSGMDVTNDEVVDDKRLTVIMPDFEDASMTPPWMKNPLKTKRSLT